MDSAAPNPLWVWLGGALAVLAAAVGALWLVRRRDPSLQPPPKIELPLVNLQDDATPATLTAAAAARPPGVTGGGSLRIEAIPSHLTRSMMTATFSCRVAVTNRGTAPVENVTIGADLITAHSSIATADQVADPGRHLPNVATVTRIEPGETVELTHEMRLPTTDIRTVSQGKARLYVPLLRVRAQAGEATAVARTFIVGTLPQGGAHKLQPFRLDEMPQTYRQIGMSALD